MMNLPIKIVDLVTLLFLSLLVVIIIFIILQRNIKRFKLRNVKDPHFLACKSIPKDLKEAILRKHALAHTYNEPGVLLTSNYTANCGPDEASTKTFLTRMKAFETSKHLEYALIEFGYRRPMSMKFEEFVDNLLKIEDDTLPKEMLREFSRFYLWAMLDPMKFDSVELRKLNRLINRIIENLASKKKPQQEQILQYKLDLNENGDYDFSKNKPFVVSTSRQQSVNNHHHHHHHKEPAIVKSKSVKFGGEANNSPLNNTNANNNNTNMSIYSTSDILPFETATVHGKSLKEQAAKFAKSVFTGAKKSSGGSGGSDDGDDDHKCHLTAPTSATVSSSLLGYSKKSDAKYEEIKNTSIESGNGSSCEQKSSPIGETEPTTSTATTKNIVITNPWSTSLQDESLLLKPDDDDLENEKIPLVVRSGKGGCSAVSGGKHAKKSSSSTAEKQSSKATKKQKNSNEIELTGGDSSKPSARVNETYEATC